MPRPTLERDGDDVAREREIAGAGLARLVELRLQMRSCPYTLVSILDIIRLADCYNDHDTTYTLFVTGTELPLFTRNGPFAATSFGRLPV